MSDRDERNLAVFFTSLGISLIVGGIFAAGAMIVIPLQVGLFEAWGANVFAEPTFYIFAGFAVAFLIVAGVGAYLSLRGYRSLKSGRQGRSDR